MHETQLWVNEPLPYAYDALEPYIDEQTMHLHHDQHLQAYVNHLNEALAPFPKFQCLSLEQLICMAGRLPPKAGVPIARNAGGVYNHDLYFKMLAPRPASVPSGDLERAVERDFGDLSALKAAMKAAALGQFGSGYAWLVSDCDGKLSVRKTPNQDTPLPLTPLLCCDVWEHAYYLQYQNRRGDYFDAWWLLVNWPQVSRAYGEFLERRPRCPHP